MNLQLLPSGHGLSPFALLQYEAKVQVVGSLYSIDSTGQCNRSGQHSANGGQLQWLLAF